MPVTLITTDPDFEVGFAAMLAAKREDSADVHDVVSAILADVRARGDAAVLDYTARFDRLDLTADRMILSPGEIDAAVAAIDARLTFKRAAETLFQGLSLGSVLLLAALGLAITFGVMGVINMAHGEFIMAGAFIAYMTQLVVTSSYISILLALPLAFVGAGLLGLLGNGPTNPRAAALVPAELRRFNPTDPENAKQQVVIDGAWWGENYQAVNQDYIDAVTG